MGDRPGAASYRLLGDRRLCTAGNGYLDAVRPARPRTDIGTGIGVTLIGGLWFVGFLVLSIVWFMTRPRGVGQIEATQ